MAAPSVFFDKGSSGLIDRTGNAGVEDGRNTPF
jgi:hypothetical protein